MALSKFIPAFLKRPIQSYIKSAVEPTRLYLPSHPGSDAYAVLPGTANDSFPVPPQHLWLDMAPDATEYLDGGKSDVETMVRIAAESGVLVSEASRILEFGCAAGRLLRHLPGKTTAEIWGVDISGEHIGWCIDNYPQLHFAVTTTVPHLPFEDRFFDFIFCGSVFTHIEDLRETWLLELGRILRPSGSLYLTIHDEHTIRLLETTSQDKWLAQNIRDNDVYNSHKDRFSMISIGRGAGSQVFYDSEYFKTRLPPIFRWLSHTPQAYGYQSAVLLLKQ